MSRGLASTTATPWLALERAWCTADHHAIDPTCPDGVAYVGIPFTTSANIAKTAATGRRYCGHRP